MSLFIKEPRHNKDWMELLAKVRQHIEKSLAKHGEPGCGSVRTYENLHEELEEFRQEVERGVGWTAAAESELLDLLAYGLLILHRRAANG